MALRLNWKNPNGFPTTVEIYRGDAPLDRANLPAPLATVPPGTLSWVDTTAAFDATYYYVFVTKTATDRVVSMNKEITVTEKRGAGPQKIKIGNEDYGYFGSIQASSFFNSGDIKAAAVNATGFPTPVVSPLWHKFIRKGKVIFVPNQSFGNVCWDYIYRAGFVYGTNDDGPAGGYQGLTGVNQMRTVTLDGDTYLIRLMCGWGEAGEAANVPWAAVSGAAGQTPSPVEALAGWKYDSEYNQLIYPIVNLTPKGQSMENVTTDTWLTTFGAASTSPSLNHGIACQEREPNATNILGRSIPTSYTPATRGHISHAGKMAGNATTAICAWVPVLELVVDVKV